MTGFNVNTLTTSPSGAIKDMATYNANLFIGYFPHDAVISYDIYKIDSLGSVTQIITGPDDGMGTGTILDCIDAANGYVFASYQGILYKYTISGEQLGFINLGDTPIKMTNDWNGTSNNFNLYFTFNNKNIGYISQDLTIFTSLNTFTFSDYDNLVVGHDIAFRKSGSNKYIYVTTGGNADIIQLNITNINSISETVINDGTFALFSDVIWAEHDNAFYVTGYIGDFGPSTPSGIIKYTVNVGVNGIVDSFGSSTRVLKNDASTNITNTTDSLSGSNVANINVICMNYSNSLTNLYVGTDDNYVIKMYPPSGTGIGGDPHVQPLIGDLYTLHNSITYCKLLRIYGENIVMNGKCWMLPQNELDRYKNIYGQVFGTMTKFTYFKYLYVRYESEELYFDIDTLFPVIYDEKLEIHNDLKTLNFYRSNTIFLSEIRKVDKMFNIVSQKYMKPKYCKNVYERIISIKCKRCCINIKVTNNMDNSYRNSIMLDIEHDICYNMNSFDGALVKFNKNNALSYLQCL